MSRYTTPVAATFALQRGALEANRRALVSGVEFGTTVTRAVADGLEGTGAAQRRTVELWRTAVHGSLDATAANVPGAGSTVPELREAVDDAFDVLLQTHADAFEGFQAELTEGADASEEFADDYLEALAESHELLVSAHEQLEAQSLAAAEQFGEAVDALGAGLHEMATGPAASVGHEA